MSHSWLTLNVRLGTCTMANLNAEYFHEHLTPLSVKYDEKMSI